MRKRTKSDGCSREKSRNEEVAFVAQAFWLERQVTLSPDT